MAIGQADISGNDMRSLVNCSPSADHMSDEFFGANHIFSAEITYEGIQYWMQDITSLTLKNKLGTRKKLSCAFFGTRNNL